MGNFTISRNRHAVFAHLLCTFFLFVNNACAADTLSDAERRENLRSEISDLCEEASCVAVGEILAAIPAAPGEIGYRSTWSMLRVTVPIKGCVPGDTIRFSEGVEIPGFSRTVGSIVFAALHTGDHNFYDIENGVFDWDLADSAAIPSRGRETISPKKSDELAKMIEDAQQMALKYAIEDIYKEAAIVAVGTVNAVCWGNRTSAVHTGTVPGAWEITMTVLDSLKGPIAGDSLVWTYNRGGPLLFPGDTVLVGLRSNGAGSCLLYENSLPVMVSGKRGFVQSVINGVRN